MTHTTKYLLIGGGLASSRAADQIRKHDPEGQILLVTDEPYAPYDRPPLSKEFLRKERPADELLYHAPERMSDERIELLLDTAVRSLDPDEHSATLENGSELRFETALIATGGRPRRLGLPGESLDGVHYLRTMRDVAAIHRGAERGRRAVIVGAGFIGLEAAASLTQLGLAVTVVEMKPRIWSDFADQTVSQFFQRHSEERGITFLTAETVTAVQGDGRVSAVATSSGHELPCDLVLIAVGIVPNVEIAERCGLAVDDGIVVDGRMRTSHAAVYAAGDAINYPDPVFGRRRRVEHWGHAEHSGQVAGMNMAGGDHEYSLLSYVWSDVFDLHLEFAGDETARDRSLLRGDPDAGAFTVLTLRDDRLTAYFAVNGSPKEFAPLQKLIRRRIDLGGKDPALQDPGYALRSLL